MNEEGYSITKVVLGVIARSDATKQFQRSLKIKRLLRLWLTMTDAMSGNWRCVSS